MARISDRLVELVRVMSRIEMRPVLTDTDLDRLVEQGLKGKR